MTLVLDFHDVADGAGLSIAGSPDVEGLLERIRYGTAATTLPSMDQGLIESRHPASARQRLEGVGLGPRTKTDQATTTASATTDQAIVPDVEASPVHAGTREP